MHLPRDDAHLHLFCRANFSGSQKDASADRPRNFIEPLERWIGIVLRKNNHCHPTGSSICSAHPRAGGTRDCSASTGRVCLRPIGAWFEHHTQKWCFSYFSAQRREELSMCPRRVFTLRHGPNRFKRHSTGMSRRRLRRLSNQDSVWTIQRTPDVTGTH